MKKTHRNLFFILTSLFVGMPSAIAGITLQGTKASSNFDYTYLESAYLNRAANGQLIHHGMYLFGQYSYTDRPLVRQLPNGGFERVIRNLQTFDLRAGVLFHPRLLVSGNLSFNRIRPLTLPAAEHLGDSNLQVKYRLSDPNAKVAFALIGDLALPIGAEDAFLSSGAFGGAVALAAGRQFDWFRAVANLGYRHSPGAQWESIDYRKQIQLGLGLLFPVHQHWRISTEATGSIALPLSAANSPGEYYVGAQYINSRAVQILAGASVSGFGNKQNDSFRLLAGLKLALFPKDNPLGRFRANPAVKTAVTPTPPPSSASSSTTPLNSTRAAVVACANQPRTLTYFGRPIHPEELAALPPLPYRSTKKSPKQVGTLQLGQMSGMAEGGIAYVHDRQILMSFDLLGFPERKRVVTIDQALLKMRVTKVSRERTLESEVLCWLKPRVCSGELIHSQNYRDSINPAYFGDFPRTQNRYFSGQYLTHATGSTGGDPIFAGELTLDVSELLKGSSTSVETLLMGEAGAPAPRNLQLVVADDTFISNDLKLEIAYTEKVCESSAETARGI